MKRWCSDDNVSVSRFRWYSDDAGSLCFYIETQPCRWEGGPSWESWDQNHVTKERGRWSVCGSLIGQTDGISASDWLDCGRVNNNDCWMAAFPARLGQDQNKVLASGRFAAKIIAIPLTSFLQFSRAPIIWKCNIRIELMLNDHHLHLLH